MNNSLRPFHLAFPVIDIDETIDWYTKCLFCKVGRKDLKWVDFNFFGHQISAHISKKIEVLNTNLVDKHNIPIRHFGIILKCKEWERIKEHFIDLKLKFEVKPYTRFKNQVGEQSTMFIKDPSGNILEFKSFKNDEMIFKD